MLFRMVSTRRLTLCTRLARSPEENFRKKLTGSDRMRIITEAPTAWLVRVLIRPISSVRTINLHSLADALRPAVAEGMTVTLRIAREGKESGQGVGHLPDGTMVVVENAKDRIGEEVEVTVTAVRQTSGGRMAFARANEQNAL